jgi:hypothetical protein
MFALQLAENENDQKIQVRFKLQDATKREEKVELVPLVWKYNETPAAYNENLRVMMHG